MYVVCMPVACIIYIYLYIYVKRQFCFWFGYNWHGYESIFANTKKYHLLNYHSEYYACGKKFY